MAIAPEDRELFERRYRPNVAFLNIQVVEGGAERADSIANALEAVDPSCDFVAIHDAARPCLTADLVDAVFAAAWPRRGDPGRSGRRHAQAGRRGRADRRDRPRRGFIGPDARRSSAATVLKRLREPLGVAGAATDDALLVEAIGHPVHVVTGSPMNLKITTAADLRLASAIFSPCPSRSGRAGPSVRRRAGDVGRRAEEEAGGFVLVGFRPPPGPSKRLEARDHPRPPLPGLSATTERAERAKIRSHAAAEWGGSASCA